MYIIYYIHALTEFVHQFFVNSSRVRTFHVCPCVPFTEASGGQPKMKLRKNTCLDNYLKSYHSKMSSSKLNGKTFPPPAKKTDDDGYGFMYRQVAPEGAGAGVKLENFPPAMSSAPFTYKDAHTGKNHKMSFMGGVTTLVQHEDSGALEPRMGWAVMDSGHFFTF